MQNQRPNAAIFDGARPDSHQKSVVSMHCFHSLFGRDMNAIVIQSPFLGLHFEVKIMSDVHF